MTNKEIINLIENVLFDLDTKSYNSAKNTLESLLQLLKCQTALNHFKKIVYEKMQYYYNIDKAKNKELYYFYQSLKNISDEDFDFFTYYQKYLQIVKLD